MKNNMKIRPVMMAFYIVVLFTCSFQSTTFLGILVSITIVSAVFADLVLLPALLYLLKPELSTLSTRPRGRIPSMRVFAVESQRRHDAKIT